MKAVLISIQPYWCFLIIAKTMGWKIDKEKTIEVRKNFPKAEDWNKLVKIYCSKDRKSFNRIPKEYQPLMQAFLGKVVGKWVCNEIDSEWFYISCDGTPTTSIEKKFENSSCLKRKEIINYALQPNKAVKVHNGTMFVYGWHISNLKIYDKPKELFDFANYDKYQVCKEKNCFSGDCWICPNNAIVVRPPQSWCYVEELGE